MKRNIIFTHLLHIFVVVSCTSYLTRYEALVLFHILCENRNSAVLGFYNSTKQYLPLYGRERTTTDVQNSRV